MLLRLKVVPPDEETLAKNFGNYTLALQLLDRFIVAKMYDTFCQMTAVYAAYMNDLNSAAAAELKRIQRKMEEGEFSTATRKYPGNPSDNFITKAVLRLPSSFLPKWNTK